MTGSLVSILGGPGRYMANDGTAISNWQVTWLRCSDEMDLIDLAGPKIGAGLWFHKTTRSQDDHDGMSLKLASRENGVPLWNDKLPAHRIVR